MYPLFYFFVSIVWLLLFHRFRPTITYRDLFTTFAAGFAAAPLAGLISYAMTEMFISKVQKFELNDFLLYFVIVGPIEEFLKFLAVLATTLKKRHINTSIDGILLAISGALGFACIENVLYLYAFGLEPTLLRLILGNLGHASYAIFWGYALAVVINENGPPSLLITGLAIGSILHGGYNYLLSLGHQGPGGLIGPILALALSLLGFFLLFQSIKIEKKRHSST